MKKILKYTFVGLMGCSVLTSCLDSALDTAPTDSMSGTTLLSNANSALIPLNGIYRSMYTSWSPTDNTHQSFGISSYTIMADVMGDDMIMDAMGSGWYWYDCLYNVKVGIQVQHGVPMTCGTATIHGSVTPITFWLHRKQ